jgi:signal transduction histidine kinase
VNRATVAPGLTGRGIILVVLVVLEFALRLRLIGTDALLVTVLGLVLGLSLLARERQWRWLVPVAMVLNAVGGSLVVALLAPFAFTRRQPRALPSVLVTVLGITSALVSGLVLGAFANTDPLIALTLAVLALTSGLLGIYLRTRSDLELELRARAEEAEARQASAEEQARRAERTRIAREMHDIVAHKISLVALQAGALEVNENLTPLEVRNAAGLMRQSASQALTELRQVLGILRGEEEGAPLAPQPTWEDVRKLVEGSRDAGIDVELFDFIDDPVPDTLARTAYRVVQEGLTNIHKHARAARSRVALIGEAGDTLLIEITNVLPRGYATDLPGARMGLSGIETRVAHAGGTITSGPTEDGNFTVKAVIPWPTTDAGHG